MNRPTVYCRSPLRKHCSHRAAISQPPRGFHRPGPGSSARHMRGSDRDRRGRADGRSLPAGWGRTVAFTYVTYRASVGRRSWGDRDAAPVVAGDDQAGAERVSGPRSTGGVLPAVIVARLKPGGCGGQGQAATPTGPRLPVQPGRSMPRRREYARGASSTAAPQMQWPCRSHRSHPVRRTGWCRSAAFGWARLRLAERSQYWRPARKILRHTGRDEVSAHHEPAHARRHIARIMARPRPETSSSPSELKP